MDIQNVNKLKTQRYKVSWKADGTRYLMYIAGRNFVYMLDRDNSVFHIANLSFPKLNQPDKNLENTLLDGVSKTFCFNERISL
jgi:mRNA-capping enzyme